VREEELIQSFGKGEPTDESQRQMREEAIENLKSLELRKSRLESCMAVIEVSSIVKPFELLGIPASPALTSTFVGFAVTFFGAIFSAYKEAHFGG
jgi:hypothetical protein